MITEYESEPIRGLPGHLPPGEAILWQGSPDWKVFARSALFVRWIGFYFAALAVLAAINGSGAGLAALGVSVVLALALILGFAMLVARTTVYTITNRRVVLRIGIALNKCINLPLALIGAAELRALGRGHGDVALTLTGRHRLGYLMLWPHARPLRFARPQPMLRALAEVDEVAAILRQACAGVVAVAAAAPVAPPLPQAAPAGLREAAA